MFKMISCLVNRFKKSEEIKDLEEIVFIKIDAKDMAKEHPQALIDLYKSQKHGFLIKNFLSPEELSAIQSYALNNKDRDVATTPVGFTYPMVFQEFSLRNKDLSKEDLAVAWEKYFNGNEYYNKHFKEETGVDLQKKINDFFESISGGKKVEVARGMNNKGSYLFGNFRHLKPDVGLISVHCGNFFGANFKLVYSHLCESVQVTNQMSFFTMIQKPEVGGELSIFNLRWVDGQRKKGFSEDQEVILSNGKKIDIDTEPQIKKFPMIPEEGDMILFQGGNIWHRVEKVHGSKQRITFGGFMGVSMDDSSFIYWT